MHDNLGCGGKVFKFCGFNTVYQSAEHTGSSEDSDKGDRKDTKIGKSFFATGSDELPQDINFLDVRSHLLTVGHTRGNQEWLIRIAFRFSAVV